MKSKETNIFNVFYPDKNINQLFNFDIENGQYIFKKDNQLVSSSNIAVYLLEAGHNFIFNCRKLQKMLTKGQLEIGLFISQESDFSGDSWLFLLNSEKRIDFIEFVDGEPISEEKIKVKEPEFFQLTRNENDLTFETASVFSPLEINKIITADIKGNCFIGLYIDFSDDAEFTCIFDNIRFTKPAPPNFIPYTDYGKSNLEIIDVETRARKIIMASNSHYEAPNWMSNNNFILNANGLLFKYNSSMDEPGKIDTGFATNNNNDHGLTYDEKHLLISHHAPGEPHESSSRIYLLPVKGGEPKLVTPEGPSYWHGLSPNGKEISYTAQRMEYYNIYRKAIDGGDEIQLTMNPALDDGPEYSPDGKYIFFNSSRGGKMKIWRMKLDGSEQEQITFDEYNDWFPHFSPDGSKLVFLSYLPNIKADDHPYYKQVMIRMIELKNRDEIKTLAFLYGGQGTINVPSWSKDGKYVAFCSYGF